MLATQRYEIPLIHPAVLNLEKTSTRIMLRFVILQGMVYTPCLFFQFVEVQPNDGFGTLLPLETIDLEVIFSPKKAKDYKFELNCKSLINRSVLEHTRNNGFLYICVFYC